MNTRPIETKIPTNSRIALFLDGASFYDSWSITLNDTSLSALEYFIAAVNRTPRWIDMCMTARNRMGRLVGLKDLGTLSRVADKQASEYMQGDRVGIFTVFENTFNEAIIGDKDKHLNVALSIYREERPGGASHSDSDDGCSRQEYVGTALHDAGETHAQAYCSDGTRYYW